MLVRLSFTITMAIFFAGVICYFMFGCTAAPPLYVIDVRLIVHGNRLDSLKLVSVTSPSMTATRKRNQNPLPAVLFTMPMHSLAKRLSTG